jgi:palmitoyltransferase
MLTADSVDPAPFLLKSRFIYEQIEHLVLKPFKTDIVIYPYDLPRELTELRLLL